MAVGCSKNTDIKTVPDTYPITEQAKDISKLPAYVPPTGEGQALPVTKGELAPIDGILLSEDKAFAAANLRIEYDRIYQIAQVNNLFLSSVLLIQEQEMRRADEREKGLKIKLDKLENSWWARNKFAVGITIGVISGALLSIGTGLVWAEIKQE